MDERMLDPVDDRSLFLALLAQQQGRAGIAPDIPMMPGPGGTWEATEPESGGASQAVLKVLDYFTRPSKALWTGVSEGLSADPKKSFAEGFRKGLMGESNIELADILGLPEAQDTDEWLPYLGKGGLRLLVNALGDPGTYVAGGVPKVAGTLGIRSASQAARGFRGLAIADRLAEKIAGGAIGKAFLSQAPVHQEAFNLAREGVQRASGETKRFLTGEGERISKALADAGMDMRDMPKIAQAIEEPWRAAELGVSDDILQLFAPLRGKARELFETENVLRTQRGMPAKELISEGPAQGYFPHVETEEAKWLKARGQGGPKEFFEAEGAPSRSLVRLVDADALTKGNVVDPLGKPFVTKLTPEYLEKAGIKEINGIYFLPDEATGGLKRLSPITASMDAIKQSGVTARAFVENPIAAYSTNILAKQKRVNFLNFIKDSVENGQWLKPAKELGEELPKDWRTPAVKGLEDYAAPKWAANQIEAMARLMHDPDTALGWIESGLKAFEGTPWGQLIKRYNSTWKRGQLAWFPGYHSANALSNQVFLYMAGIHNPYRVVEAARVQFGKGADVISGVKNSTLRAALEDREILNPFIPAVIPELERAGQKRFTEAVTSRLGPVGEAAQAGIQKLERGTDWIFENVAGGIEGNAKAAATIDYIKKAMAKGAAFDDRLLDQAARFAKDAMYDYGQLTTLEQHLKMFFPFMTFTRKILGSIAKDAASQPGRLANVSRFWNFSFQPLRPEESEFIPEYMKSQGPASKIFGGSLATASGEPGVILSQRFNPFGQIEDLLRRPGEFAVSALGPWIKAPYKIFSGSDIFKEQDIDPIAKTGPAALVNPLVGGEYALASYKAPGGFNIPAMYASLMTETPLSRGLATFGTLAGNLLWEDPGRPEMSGAEKAAWYLTGGRVLPVDTTRTMISKVTEWEKQGTAIKGKLKQAAIKHDAGAVAFYQKQYINHISRPPIGASMNEGA